MKRTLEPEWSAEQIGMIRKMYRAGASMKDAMQALGTTMSRDGFRHRCLKLGMRFDNRPSIYAGTSVLNKGKEDAA